MTCYGIYNYDNLELDGSYDTATAANLAAHA